MLGRTRERRAPLPCYRQPSAIVGWNGIGRSSGTLPPLVTAFPSRLLVSPLTVGRPVVLSGSRVVLLELLAASTGLWLGLSTVGPLLAGVVLALARSLVLARLLGLELPSSPLLPRELGRVLERVPGSQPLIFVAPALGALWLALRWLLWRLPRLLGRLAALLWRLAGLLG